MSAEDHDAEPLVFLDGPHKELNPLTGRHDLPAVPYLKDMRLRGERLGYVNTKPGGAIFLLKSWHEEQKRIIVEAILEKLESLDFDIEQPRKVSQPKADGLIKKQRDADEESAPRIVMPN